MNGSPRRTLGPCWERKNGEGGIRTRGTRKGTLVFETSSISHSDTSPCGYSDRPYCTLHSPPGKQKTGLGPIRGVTGVSGGHYVAFLFSRQNWAMSSMALPVLSTEPSSLA